MKIVVDQMVGSFGHAVAPMHRQSILNHQAKPGSRWMQIAPPESACPECGCLYVVWNPYDWQFTIQEIYTIVDFAEEVRMRTRAGKTTTCLPLPLSEDESYQLDNAAQILGHIAQGELAIGMLAGVPGKVLDHLGIPRRELPCWGCAKAAAQEAHLVEAFREALPTVEVLDSQTWNRREVEIDQRVAAEEEERHLQFIVAAASRAERRAQERARLGRIEDAADEEAVRPPPVALSGVLSDGWQDLWQQFVAQQEGLAR